MNASSDAVPFTLPPFAVRQRWETVLDTYDEHRVGEIHDGRGSSLGAHSLAVFELHGNGEAKAL
jgi:hypothetical protein